MLTTIGNRVDVVVAQLFRIAGTADQRAARMRIFEESGKPRYLNFSANSSDNLSSGVLAWKLRSEPRIVLAGRGDLGQQNPEPQAMAGHDRDSTVSSLTLLNARQGDDDAWRSIWERYSDRVFRQAMRFGVSPVAADEITVDVFRKVWDRLDDFSRNGQQHSLGAWMNRITQTTTLDFLRRHRRERLVCDLDDRPLPERSLPADGECDEVEVSPVWLALWQALGIVENNSSVRSWECFQLSRFAHLSQREIGARLGMSESNVSSTVRRVFEKIRDQAVQQLHLAGFSIDDEGRVTQNR